MAGAKQEYTNADTDLIKTILEEEFYKAGLGTPDYKDLGIAKSVLRHCFDYEQPPGSLECIPTDEYLQENTEKVIENLIAIDVKLASKYIDYNPFQSEQFDEEFYHPLTFLNKEEAKLHYSLFLTSQESKELSEEKIVWVEKYTRNNAYFTDYSTIEAYADDLITLNNMNSIRPLRDVYTKGLLRDHSQPYSFTDEESSKLYKLRKLHRKALYSHVDDGIILTLTDWSKRDTYCALTLNLLLNHYSFMKSFELLTHEYLINGVTYHQWLKYFETPEKYQGMPSSWWSKLV